MKPKVAFVVQRCGIEVNGGAEALCLSVARAMAAVWDVTIVTTCARDYVRWENWYPAGESWIDGVRLMRFPVDAERDPATFSALSQRIVDGGISGASLGDQETWMRAQGPFSSPLFGYLENAYGAFDAFFFFTYLYATTYFGLPLVAPKAVLVPFAHDEWPLQMSMWEALFAQARRVVFSTPEERDFVRRRFPRVRLAGEVVGVGIDPPAPPDPRRFVDTYDVRTSYVLYLGRIDEAKKCSLLIEHFRTYKERYEAPGGDLSLFLIGRAAMPVPDFPWLRHFGFVEEQTKWDAIAGCAALAMPSTFESLSLVLLEAWKAAKPVLVNARSDVLVGQCRRAQGGLWFSDADEFGIALRTLTTDVGATLGANGAAFVERDYSWETVVPAYERVLSSIG